MGRIGKLDLTDKILADKKYLVKMGKRIHLSHKKSKGIKDKEKQLKRKCYRQINI